jgi:hypothetical protein
MDENLIKQAYAYGSAVALQELGFDAQQAEIGGIKLAAAKIAEGEEEMLAEQMSRPERPSGVLPTLFGAAGAGVAPKGKRWAGAAGTEFGGLLGAGAGTVGGGLAGAGIGALVNVLSKGRAGGRMAQKFTAGAPAEVVERAAKYLPTAAGALAGGALGNLSGGFYGRNRGFHAAVDPREGVDY